MMRFTALSVHFVCECVLRYLGVDALGTLERLLKPVAYILRDPRCKDGAEGSYLVEVVGHVATWRQIVDSGSSVGLSQMVGNIDTSTLPRITQCYDNNDSITRCHLHNFASMKRSYDMHFLEDGSFQVDMLYLIVDPPTSVPENCQKQLVSHHSLVHNVVGQKAKQWRRGQHVYVGCNELCPRQKCLHKHEIDLVWILQPLWKHLEHKHELMISFINIGCRDFAWPDPLESLLHSGAKLSGLCIDGNGTALSQARKTLEGHAIKFIEAWLTPNRVHDILRDHSVDARVHILKIDIDSFDADVLHAVLMVTKPSIIIVEFEFQVPPPFSWARHFTAKVPWEGASSMYPASLAYFVEMLRVSAFHLFKMNHNDAIFVDAKVADLFVASETGLEFPVDEWACYLSQAFSDDEWVRIPHPYVREWITSEDVFGTLELVWGNVSKVSRPPFSFDLLAALPSA